MNFEYVIVEYNQASHRPSLATRELFDDIEEAITEADHMRANTASVGRKETYAVALLEYIEDPR